MDIVFQLKHPFHTLAGLIRKLYYLVPNDEWFLRIVFPLEIGHALHLKHPKTFNEKLQWLKLNDRKEEYTSLVDKAKVKHVVASIIGEKYIIPTIGIWNNANDIDWERLPNKFVLKTTHGSGGSGIYICTDKGSFDKKLAVDGLNRSLKGNSTYYKYKEWPYKNVERKIIAEEYIGLGNDVPTDYKIHCFNGEPKFILVCRNRFSETGLIDDFYTTDWQHLDVRRPGKNNPDGVPCPPNLQEMIDIARKLSKDIPFVRVDLYLVGKTIYFSELTFYPASGLVRFEPEEWDMKFGSMLYCNTNIEKS